MTPEAVPVPQHSGATAGTGSPDSTHSTHSHRTGHTGHTGHIGHTDGTDGTDGMDGSEGMDGMEGTVPAAPILRAPGSAPDAAPDAVSDSAPAVSEEELLRLAGSVPDPELPVLTLRELGVLRGVRRDADGGAEVELTPTWTGCPAVEAMSEDIRRVLRERGIPRVEVRIVLSPPWSTDDITPQGRRKLSAAGIAPPRPSGGGGPVPVRLGVRCPRCGSADTELLSPFSATACTALRRCVSCLEPFDHIKEV